MTKYICIILISCLALCAFSQDSFLWDHGRLIRSANGHYLQHEDGTPFLYWGDTAWRLPERVKKTDADLYLDNAAQCGFNAVQIVVCMDKFHDMNNKNAYGFRPFETLDNGRPDITRPVIQAGGSGEAPNDYWDFMDYIVQAAKIKNLYVALLPVWGSQHVNLEDAPVHEENAKIYGEFIGSRYKEQPNIIWVLVLE